MLHYSSVSVLFAILLVLLMGYAIQRGATCCVAAVDEIIRQHRSRKLAAILLASAWVSAGLWGATAAGWNVMQPRGFTINWQTVLGSVLLGLGAFVNGACVFGSVARLGCGQWSYGFSLLGFFLGCLAYEFWSPMMLVRLDTPTGHWALPVSILLIVVSVGFWAYSKAPVTTKQGQQNKLNKLAAKVWSPAAATSIIGITFVGVFLLVGGKWSYTDVLSEWAKTGKPFIDWRVWLLIALLTGAFLGGWTAGLIKPSPIRPWVAFKCLAGSFLMGLGSMLIPGSNDGLLLVGLPFLWSYAWLAVTLMFLTIAAAMLMKQKLLYVLPIKK